MCGIDRLNPEGGCGCRILIFLCLTVGCTPSVELPPETPARNSTAAVKTIPRSASPDPLRPSLLTPHFTEVQNDLGVEHIYLNGASGEELMVEATGGGAGWLDYDRDGLQDLYLNQGGNPKVAGLASNPSDQLFRNRDGRSFRNATGSAEIREPGYSQGVAPGDFNNDGFSDIYVTNVGANRLFCNQGDGTFLEISAEAGLADLRWSSSAAWADLDADGDLDLYVCNYLKFDPDNPVICRHENGESGMCDPHHVDAWPDECYLNSGDGRFPPVARQLGLYGDGNKALGVAIADFNGDDRPDIYVCNDTTANFMFLQQDNFTFIESAQRLGCAVSGYGEAQASMGVAVSDFNRDGRPDLYLTHFARESNTLYQNLGESGFADVTSITGLHTPTLHFLGFGVAMSDFDFNGQDDVFIANGHIDDWSPHEEDYQQFPQLFTFDGHRWHETGANAGPVFQQRFVGRGVALADYDCDGDLDIACVRHGQSALILRNEEPHGNWLRFRFIGRSNNRNGIGTKVTIRADDGIHLVQQLCGGTSYCSTHEPALTFGVGKTAVSAEIHWPNGLIQTLEHLTPNQEVVVLESSGQPW